MEAIAFSDGSSRGNPGPGGWGSIVRRGGRVRELTGVERGTTNNRMELTAAAEAIAATEPRDRVTVVTDSAYVANGASKWLSGWERKGWKTATGDPVKNEDLWRRISSLAATREVTWRIVPGHAGVPGNERCDQMATASADGLRVDLYDGPADRYPIKLELPGRGEVLKRLGAEKGAPAPSSGGRAHSYLSLVDGVAARHRTWGECEARVRGVQNARFRKTRSAEEEMDILQSWGVRL